MRTIFVADASSGPHHTTHAALDTRGWAARLALLVLIACCAAANPATAFAQNVQNAQNTPDAKRRSGARIDPATLALQIEIPLGNYPGRNGTDIPIALNYSSKLWRMEYKRKTLGPGNEPYYSYEAEYDRSMSAGWTSTLDWFLRPAANGLTYYGAETPLEKYNSAGAALPGPTYDRTVARMHVVLPDGSRHELRRSDAVLGAGSDTTSGTFYSVDGSRLRYESATKTLFMPDGDRIVYGPNPQYVDHHGNTLSYGSGQWTDTLGRAFAPPPLTAGAQQAGDYVYTLPGAGGAARTYVFRWRNLGDVLTDPSQPLRYKGDRGVSYPHPPTNQPSLFQTFDAQSVVVSNGQLFNPVVLHQIVLPNGRAYTFTYNAWGEITKLVHPTGGYETFTYGGAVALSGQLDDPLYAQANRGVTGRSISPSGQGGDLQVWQYGFGVLQTSALPRPLVRTITAPDGSVTEMIFHTSRGASIKYGFDDARAGKVYDERVYAYAGGPMLRRTLTYWERTGPVPYDPNSTATRDARPGTVVDILLDTGGNALYKTTRYEYDNDLNVTRVKHYGYVAVDQQTAQSAPVTSFTPPESAVLRTDETDYLTWDQAYRNRNLLSLPVATRVKDAAGNVIAQSEVRYDEAAYPLLPCGAGVGWADPATGVRGLATTIRRWLDTSGAWLEAHAQYDACGNARKSWDAKGNLSEIDYSSAYHHAYPTQNTSPAPDPSNVRATNTPLVSSTAYDFWTGLTTSTTDANGKTTSYQYNDQLDRLTRVDRPDGGWTQYNYGSNSCGDWVGTYSSINASQSTEGYQFIDGLGRPVRSFQFQNNATDWITVDTQYDAMGRVWRTSNPYHSGGCGAAVNPSGRWTTTQYDALGRVGSVTTPDGAVVGTAYSGNQTTVTDQAGKARRSVTDALGRLTQVVEAPGAGACLADGAGCATNYLYDALGNLRRVDQGGQLRYFMYDSLGRLTRARNPEQAVNASLNTAADPWSGNYQWSLGYSYDANSNLHQRTDARGVTTTYTYDNINRVIRTDYSDGTPMTLFTYDFAANGRGRFYANYESSVQGMINYVHAYDAAGRPTSGSANFYWNGTGWLPAYTYARTYDLAGNVTSQTYPSGRTVSYTQFDAAGRLKAVSGNLGDGAARTYSTGISYDEAGRISQEQFGTQTPLYHKRAYNVRGQLYDVRLSTYSQQAAPWNWNRGALINYYAQNDLSAQTNEARANSGPDNNGNVFLQQHWVPGNDQITAYSWMNQWYGYDALNRISYVREQHNGGSYTGEQHYAYDRWGNRTVNAAATWGAGIPEPQFSVDAATNRLGVPAGYGGVMQYDAAGNLANDTYTGAGGRTYDAENRMTSAWGPGLNGGAYQNVYVYDAAGKRVRRRMESGEVWHVYGFDGELIAEYAAAAAPSQPRKEYAYRAGEMLVAAESNGQVRWLVADHLGTPRMTADQTGSLAGIRRHDYLPFGEEVGANTGGRTAAQGYSPPDRVRQGFTGKEADNETYLNYFFARYYAPSQGRFTSVDPRNAGARADDPQSWNGYSYVRNLPTSAVDPDGRGYVICENNGECYDHTTKEWQRLFNRKNAEAAGVIVKGDRDSGVILDKDGNQIGTYKFTGHDYWNDFQNGVVQALREPDTWVNSIPNAAINTAAIWTRNFGKGLSPAENAYDHWKRHGGDFPWLKNALQYAKEAKEFIKHPPPGSVVKIRSNGDKLVYHPGTNTFAVGDKYGTPRTMYKPDPAQHKYPTNWDYWLAQK